MEGEYGREAAPYHRILSCSADSPAQIFIYFLSSLGPEPPPIPSLSPCHSSLHPSFPPFLQSGPSPLPALASIVLGATHFRRCEWSTFSRPMLLALAAPAPAPTASIPSPKPFVLSFLVIAISELFLYSWVDNLVQIMEHVV